MLVEAGFLQISRVCETPIRKPIALDFQAILIEYCRQRYWSPRCRTIPLLTGELMPFINIDDVEPLKIVPGCRMRTPFGENLMFSYLEMDEGAEVPLHDHPHEQGGMLLQGRVELTIGTETRVVEPGAMFIVPPHTPHRAVAVGGPAVVLDVFSPVREDYADLYNKYIPVNEKEPGRD